MMGVQDFPSSKGMRRGRDKDQAILQDLPDQELLVLEGIRDESQVGLELGRVFDHHRVGKNVDRDLDGGGVFIPEKVYHEGKIVSSKAFARMDPDSSALALLEVAEDLFGLDLCLEDLAGEVVENLPRIGEDHLL